MRVSRKTIGWLVSIQYVITSPIKSNEVQKISADFRVKAAKLNKNTKVGIVVVTLTSVNPLDSI